MSRLNAMMEAASAEEHEAPSAEATPEDKSAGGSSPDMPAGEASEVASAPEAKAEAAAEKPQAQDKLAARFAALARQHQRNLAQEQAITSRARELETRERQVQERESGIASRLAEVEGVLSDPAKLFAHLETAFGIRSVEDLQKHARGAWERPKPKAEEDPTKRPLTRADLEAHDRARLAQENERRAASEFARISGDDSKYEAAAMLFSEEERVRHGNRIATSLAERGIRFSLEDIADAVDEFARQDPRYAKLQSRSNKSDPPATSKSAPASAAKVTPDSAARQSAQGRTLSNDAATERLNGAPARLSHKERLKQMLRS